MSLALNPLRSCVVLLIRIDPDRHEDLTQELQKKMLTDYCAARKLHVCRTVVLPCRSGECPQKLEELIRSFPPETNAVLAARIHRYSNNLKDLADLCMRTKSLYHIDLYCMELPDPIRTYLYNLSGLSDF